jgi:stage II sporulation protein AA (anti-sigma F factor antagonist)
MLEVIATPSPEHLCIVVRGQVNTDSAARLQQSLETALAAQPAPRCVLDLAGLSYISSSGLRVLLAIAKRIRNGGGRLVLCGLQPPVQAVLELSGFTRILAIAPDLAAAREQLAST